MARPSASPRRKARTTYLLSQAHVVVRAHVDNGLRALGATSLQYTVLATVAKHPGSSSAALSRRFYRTQQAMGQLLSALEERGWIERSEDAANRRILRVGLTAEGAALVAAGDALMDRLERRLFATVDAGDLEAFRSVLAALVLQGVAEEEGLLAAG
jgi:DNA-binding MarR family transcriptional regulator